MESKNGQKGRKQSSPASPDAMPNGSEESIGSSSPTIVVTKKTVLSTPKGTVNEKVKKNPSVSVKKAPKFNDQGECSRCNLTSLLTEAISCQLCETTFHACCREKRGGSSSSAICTPTFHEKLMPVMSKFGTANENRWGHFFFICNSCNKEFKSFKSSRFSPSSDRKETGAQTETVQQSESRPSETQDLTNKDSVKGINTYLNDFKVNILESLDSLITSKLDNLINIQDKSHQRTPSSETVQSDYDALSVSTQCTSNSMSYAKVVSSNFSPIFKGQNVDNFVSEMRNASSTKSLDFGPDNTLDEYVLVVDTTSQTTAGIDEIAKEVDIALKSVPVNSLKANKKSGKIVVSFPSEQGREMGKKTLASIMDNLQVNDAKKMFPKITVTGIPKYLVSGLTSDQPISKPLEHREKVKELLEAKFLEKNAYIQNMA
ncbi:hypothetical protein ACHWQZ_G016311 [Mnemiopsis leidyi]